MSFLTTLALVSVLLPQGQPATQGGDSAGKPGLLTPNERSALHDKLAKYLVDDDAYQNSEGKAQEVAKHKRERTKGAFEDAWSKFEAKGLLASMVDLRAVWENCFLVNPPSGSLAQLRVEKTKTKTIHEHAYWLPKTYKPTTPMRLIWQVPGMGEKAGSWAKPQDWFNATWDKSATAGDSIIHITVPPQGLELDPAPDLSREAGYDEEQRRIELMWETFGAVLTGNDVERSRVFLDCARGSCAFGLRFVAMFPDRFAGVVLRAPSAVDGIRLGSLLGIPILLLRTAATADVVDALKKQIEAVSPGNVTVLDAKDEYPHHGHTTDIEAWMGDRKRTVMASKVVIEPNHEKYRRAYWAKIEIMDPLGTAPLDKKPRLECFADRPANRITVKTVGVDKFTLFLNDDLVDLDKEFTVVVNDKAFTEKKTRAFPLLRDQVTGRKDWDFLFTVAFTTSVPK
jgi:hypothetical protein